MNNCFWIKLTIPSNLDSYLLSILSMIAGHSFKDIWNDLDTLTEDKHDNYTHLWNKKTKFKYTNPKMSIILRAKREGR